MKYIGIFLRNVVICIWVAIAIFTTLCLLQHNEYGVTEFGDYTFFVIDNDSLEPNYVKNDMLLVRKRGYDKYNVGDQLFFYKGNKLTNRFINLGLVTDIMVNGTTSAAFAFGDVNIDYSNIIGAPSDVNVYHKVGLVYNLFTSRWGFMFLIIFPTLYAVVYEIYGIVVEIKKESIKEIKKAEKELDNEK